MAIPAGRINKLFGTEGGVMLTLYPAFPQDFDLGTPLLVTIDSLEVPLYCQRLERRGISGATATFADFDTDRRVLELLGLEFRIDVGVEEQDEEFYMEDLIGFAVTANGLKGTLSDYYDSDANPLFELEIDNRKVLVPAAEEFIAHIDFKGRKIRFVLPEGLIELES